MTGFKTLNGTMYQVDTKNHWIVGGQFRYPIYYVRAQIIIGLQAHFWLPNGQVIQTSPVIAYF